MRYNESAGAMLAIATEAGMSLQLYNADNLLIDTHNINKNCTPNLTSTPVPLPIDTATAVPDAVHVGDLDGSLNSLSGGVWLAHVTVVVHDDGHVPVAGVTVTSAWSGGMSSTVSCVTDGNGHCTFTANDIPKREKTATFTIVDIVDSNRPYQSADNHDPDNDSNGTAIEFLVR